MKKGGIRALSADMKQKLDNWEAEPVNIAVIGRSGVGKSTFINAIRGDVQPESEVYAGVGYKETTDKAAPYSHPNNKKLIFWDLPGAGTKTFPRKKYLSDKRVNFGFYDIYIILSSERFTEDETWLAEAIHKQHKTFLFVRTKVDSEIHNDKLRLKKKADPQKVVQIIRDDCKANLKPVDKFDETRDLYLIGSLELSNPLLDFDKLCRRLVEGLPGLKGDALLFSLDIMAPTILEAKIKSLRKRIWGMGVVSAATGAIPIPGVGLTADTALISGETRFYRKQLGITTSDLKEVAEIVGMPVDKFAAKYNIKSFALALTQKSLLAGGALLASEITEMALELTIIPVIGSVVGGTLSFFSTVKILRAMLRMMESDAYQVLEILQEHTEERVRLLSKTTASR